MNCEERRCQILLFLFKASLRTVCQREGKVFIQRAANVAQAAQVNIRTRSVSWIFTCSNFFLQDLVDYSHLTLVICMGPIHIKSWLTLLQEFSPINSLGCVNRVAFSFPRKWHDGITGSIPCSCIDCISASVLPAQYCPV